MNTILFVWMVMAANNYNSYPAWVNQGEFRSSISCEDAAKILQLTRYKCIIK